MVDEERNALGKGRSFNEVYLLGWTLKMVTLQPEIPQLFVHFVVVALFHLFT